MVEFWNSEAASSWATKPQRYDGMLAPLGRLALDAAGLAPGERVLDVGCGGGQLALEAAERVGADGEVVGVDVSAPLLEVARERAAAAGLGHVSLLEADAQEHRFPLDGFDAVVSRFGVMFFADPVAAFANLLAATAPGGRLAFVAWQEATANEWAAVPIGAVVPHVGMPPLPPPGAPGPFAFADADRLRTILTGAGWTGVRLEDVRTTLLVGGQGTLDDAVAYLSEDAFGRALLQAAEPEPRAAALVDLRAALAASVTEEGVRLGAAVWVVTAERPA